MKKNLLFFIVLIVLAIFIALVVTFSQVGLPRINNQGWSSGFGLVEQAIPSFDSKMMIAERASVLPAPDNSLITNQVSSQRKITQTGHLNILVETAETAVQNVKIIAEDLDGYVSNVNLYETSPGVKAGSVTIRIPADNFNQALANIKKSAIKVESESVNTDDVTDQFIDIEARLKNLKVEEAQYLDILQKAEAIDDIVNVTSQLNRVRGQIESWQAQFKYLNSQIDLSTITVNLTAEKDIQILGLHWRPLIVIKQALRSLLDGLVNYVNWIVVAIIFLPVIILWGGTIALILWVAWLIYRSARKLLKSKKKPKKTSS